MFVIIVFFFLQDISDLSVLERREKASLHRKKAIRLYGEKEFKQAINQFKIVLKYRPNFSRAIFNIASLSYEIGDIETSSRYFERLADFSFAYRMENFPKLSESMKKKFTTNFGKIGKIEDTFSLKELALVTESVAYSTKRKCFYVSSIYKRKILKIENDFETDFSSQSDSLFSVFNLKIDNTKSYLWATSSAIPQSKNVKEEEIGKSFLLKYDIETEKLLNKYSFPNDGKEHIWGDFEMTDSQIFISDSKTNCIYQFDIKTETYSTLVPYRLFYSLQGLSLNSNHSKLYFSDYSEGIFIYDFRSKKIKQLASTKTTYLRGTDGLYFYKNSLILVQNGTNPHRILQVHLGPSGEIIKSSKVLLANYQLLNDPTMGDIKNNHFYFIANSGWSNFDKNNQITLSKKVKKSSIIEINIE